MADLFRAKAGTLIKNNVQSAGFVSVEGLDALLKGGKMLGTSFKLDRGQDILTLKTLSNLYYLYSFGEAPGRIMVGGLLFFADCTSGTNTSVIGDINAFYEQNNAWARSTPIRIAAGGAVFRCLLSNLSVSADTNPYNYASFSLAFQLIPGAK